MSKSVYVLFAQDNRDSKGCKGVYTSLVALKKGVDYWMKETPNLTLAYEAWSQNYAQEPNHWGWCYIARTADRKALQAGGGWVPPEQHWGFNILKRRTQIHKEYIKFHDELMKDVYK